MDIDLDELAALVELLKESDFSEFRYEKGDLRIVVRRGGESSAEAAPSPLQAMPDNQVAQSGAVAGNRQAAPGGVVKSPAVTSMQAAVPEGAVSVTSPLLGTFYTRPKPGEPPFVSLGSRVEPDTVLCIVEVMKLMNSVVAGMFGVVAAIHATDGELVQHGHLLFSITPTAA